MNKRDYEKITQALTYLAQKEGGTIDKMKAIKLLWAADRFHVRRYGRMITNDRYIAMRNGPVGSAAKDVAQRSMFLPPDGLDYSKTYIAPDKAEYAYQARKEPDLDIFSESELEALDFAWSKLGNDDQWELVELTHGYPEWLKYKENIENDSQFTADMDILDFFENPEKDGVFEDSPESLAAAKETYNENILIGDELR